MGVMIKNVKGVKVFRDGGGDVAVIATDSKNVPIFGAVAFNNDSEIFIDSDDQNAQTVMGLSGEVVVNGTVSTASVTDVITAVTEVQVYASIEDGDESVSILVTFYSPGHGFVTHSFYPIKGEWSPALEISE